MLIAVLGTGMVGRAIAGRLLEVGHDVVMGTRDPDATRGRDDDTSAWLADHADVELASFSEVGGDAEVVINASNGLAALDILAQVGSAALAGKVLVDISNPLDFSGGFPPTLAVKDTDSLGEQIQRAYPDTFVVKTLNTMNASVMADPGRLGEPSTVFVSGDDADAKAVVTELLESLGHTDVLDLGGLETARGAEMYVALWIRTWQSLGTLDFNIKVVRG